MRSIRLRAVSLALAGAGLFGLGGCRQEVCPTPVAVETPAPPAPHGGSANALHAFRRLSDRISSGAQPEGEADFATLANLGFKTVVSVDGAKPAAEAARRHGLRYVHVPIGYDGIPPEKAEMLAKAFTTLEGPFYVHCHHGKHRGPAACALGRLILDRVSPEKAVEEMKAAGTDPKYRGLYAAPAAFRAPAPERLAAVGPLVEYAPVASFAREMVEVDAAWERLGEVRHAGWKSPAEHPDVDPPHEATIFAERFREIVRRDDVKGRPADFHAHATDSEKAAWDLAAALRATSPDAKAAQAAYDRIKASCTACHTKYRDNR